MKILDFVKLIGVASTAIGLAACDIINPQPQPRPRVQPRPQPRAHPRLQPRPLPRPQTKLLQPSPPTYAPVTLADALDGSEASKYSTAVQRTFAEGLNLYDNGEYLAAIKKFQSSEMSKAWPELRVRTLKYLAFSYCVTDQLQACQQAFYDAIQINPQFQLQPSERDHPIWGPIFQKAESGPPPSFQRTDKQPSRRR
jgi:hypothetical protein